MTCDFNLLPHEGIRSLHPYIPGKSTEELSMELGLTDIIKLASNENPLGCSPQVSAALAALTPKQIATYSISASHPLRQKLANHLGIDKEMIMLGNGSDAVIPLLQLCFALHSDKHVLTHQHAFIAYRIHAQTLGLPVVTTPLLPNWQVDIDAMIASCNTKTALIFIATPNNPTGLAVEPSEIERLLQNISETTILVLDEAYYEYANKAHRFDALRALRTYPNLVITRTFSKVFGLAGLRLGYVVANPQIISILLRAVIPFSMNEAALVAGCAALDDTDFVQQSVNNNTMGLKQLQQGLTKLGLDYFDSQANFILFDWKKDTTCLYQELQHHGIIVRPLHQYGLTNYIRVTIGTLQQNNRFLEKLEEIQHEK